MTTLLPTNRIRGLVSKKKKRFQEGGFDLDLSYITDNIIAMGFPSEKLEGIYRNPIGEVRKFLGELHPGHYKIYNLCSERRYDHKKFSGPVREFPFDDHNPCPLAMIYQFCLDMDEWLDEDPQNVAVIHCKAGKGRTGMMICCYLQHAKRCQSASEALQLFAAKRTLNKKGVTLHSQRRFVGYYERVAMSRKLPEPTYVRLEKIRMHSIPVFKKGGSEPWFSIYKGGNTIYYSDPVKGKKGNQVVDFNCGTVLTNDIKIEFYHKDLKGKMFYFWFHTAYIKKNYFCLRKRDLEQACKDTNNKHFSPGFKIELFFKPKGEADNENPETSEMGKCGKCQKSIVAEESSVILDDIFFHWECVQCDKCGKNFGGSRNCIIKDGKPVCERCEGDEFFSPCNACFRPLTTQRNAQVGDSSWHIDCFRCSYCSKLLNHKDSSTFVVDRASVFCPEHRGQIIGNNVCSAPTCPNPNRDVDMINVLGSHFHTRCFRCSECSRTLNHVEDDFIEKDGLPCCISHEEPEICFGCGLTIPNKDTITSFNETWHPSCLHCYEPGCSSLWSIEQSEELAEMKQGKLICKEHGLLCCYSCKERIQPDNLLKWNNQDLHSFCFVCNTCNQVIGTPNDPSSYFLTEGKPNCIKHQQKCARCSRVIPPTQLILAKGATWHKTCFTCQLPSCKVPLDPEQFVIIKGKNFCSSHPQCTRCCNPVQDNDKYEDDNGIFHRECYKCGQCNKTIDPDNSAFFGNRLLCKSCHPNPVCARCDKILGRGHLVVGSQHYHENCFCCSNCGDLFASAKDPVAVGNDGLPLCKSCIKPKYLCCNCNKGIFEQVLETLGKTFHTECFTCESCQVVLGGSFALLDDHIFCRDCSLTVQRAMCEVCNQLLTGKYIVVQAHYYHQNCKPCAVCSQFVQISDRLVTSSPTGSITCGPCSTINSRNSYQQRTSAKQAQPTMQPASPIQQRQTTQRNSQRPGNTGGGFAKALPTGAPRESFRSVSGSGTRTRTMSVSDHRNSRTMPTNSTGGETGTGQVRNSRSQQGTMFVPSMCGQQGFLARRKGHGSWDRFWVVLNGKNLVFYAAPGGPELESFFVSPNSALQLNEAEKVIEIASHSQLLSVKADTKPELDLWFSCLNNAMTQ